jgi:hypothetical protein
MLDDSLIRWHLPQERVCLPERFSFFLEMAPATTHP